MATTVLHEFPSSIVKLKGAKDQSCEVWLEFSQAVYEEMVDKMSHTHTHTWTMEKKVITKVQSVTMCQVVLWT